MSYLAVAAKKPVNLSLNGDLLRIAKELGLNLSGIAEAALDRAVRERLAQVWLRENEGAIQAYNAHVEAKGTFSDGLRSF